MTKSCKGRRRMAAVGAVALVAAGALTAGCGSSTEAPPITTTTTTTSPVPATTSASPTEKSISPGGGNLFTPNVTANPAPNVPGGRHPGINGVP